MWHGQTTGCFAVNIVAKFLQCLLRLQPSDCPDDQSFECQPKQNRHGVMCARLCAGPTPAHLLKAPYHGCDVLRGLLTTFCGVSGKHSQSIFCRPNVRSLFERLDSCCRQVPSLVALIGFSQRRQSSTANSGLSLVSNNPTEASRVYPFQPGLH